MASPPSPDTVPRRRQRTHTDGSSPGVVPPTASLTPAPVPAPVSPSSAEPSWTSSDAPEWGKYLPVVVGSAAAVFLIGSTVVGFKRAFRKPPKSALFKDVKGGKDSPVSPAHSKKPNPNDPALSRLAFRALAYGTALTVGSAGAVGGLIAWSMDVYSLQEFSDAMKAKWSTTTGDEGLQASEVDQWVKEAGSQSQPDSRYTKQDMAVWKMIEDEIVEERPASPTARRRRGRGGE